MNMNTKPLSYFETSLNIYFLFKNGNSRTPNFCSLLTELQLLISLIEVILMMDKMCSATIPYL